MSSHWLAAWIIGVALVAPERVVAQVDSAAQADSSNKLLVALIDQALATPLANVPLWKALADSARARLDVEVRYSPGLFSWMCRSSKSVGPRVWKTVLMTAYIAGNMRAQLLSGVPGNEPMAGVRAVFDVYAKLRARDARFSIPEIDEWLELDGKGALEPRITEALGQSCPT